MYINYVDDLGGAVVFSAILFSDYKVTPLLLESWRVERFYFDLIEFKKMPELEIGGVNCKWMFHGPGSNAISVFLEF